VGHSLAGAAISGAAERTPERVRDLVYVAGFLLETGQAPVDIIRADTGSDMRSARLLADDGRSSSIDPSRIGDALCGDCHPDDLLLLHRRLVPESTAVAREPVIWTPQRFGTVKRHYIECTEDRIISIRAQRSMQDQMPCDSVITIDSAHLPFLTAPAALAAAISSVTDRT
jgi:pimeloyl-ACP methyl ester carboxylesterase